MTITIKNTAEARITPTATWTSTPTHCVLWVGAIALDQAALAWAAAPGAPPNSGQAIVFAAAGLTFTLTSTDFNEAGLLAILQAGADEVVFKLSLHSGDPGNAYTANEIVVANNAGYARVALTCAIASA